MTHQNIVLYEENVNFPNFTDFFAGSGQYFRYIVILR